MLTPNEVANRLKLERDTIYRWIKTGKLKATIIPNGRKKIIRIDESEIDRILRKSFI